MRHSYNSPKVFVQTSDKFHMKTLTVFDYFYNKEVETTFEKFTGLNLGDRVRHINTNQVGSIVGFHDQGEYSWGGRCITISVFYDNGETFDCLKSLLTVINELS